MEKGCLRVSPIGTDVTGIVVRPTGAVCRCVSTADTSLSLSLSVPDLAGNSLVPAPKTAPPITF
jgi:hypothetical protein